MANCMCTVCENCYIKRSVTSLLCDHRSCFGNGLNKAATTSIVSINDNGVLIINSQRYPSKHWWLYLHAMSSYCPTLALRIITTSDFEARELTIEFNSVAPSTNEPISLGCSGPSSHHPDTQPDPASVTSTLLIARVVSIFIALDVNLDYRYSKVTSSRTFRL